MKEKNLKFINYEKIISVGAGDVLHCIKNDSVGYINFGEVYFSEINSNCIKAWKKHKLITSNIVVPVGKVKFILVDETNEKLEYREYIMSKDNYYRLTIPPKVWYGFMGISSSTSLVVNIIDDKHNPLESESADLKKFKYDW